MPNAQDKWVLTLVWQDTHPAAGSDELQHQFDSFDADPARWPTLCRDQKPRAMLRQHSSIHESPANHGLLRFKIELTNEAL